MKKGKNIIFLTLVFVLIASSALAGVEAYSLSWWTVDGGGGLSSGGDYHLSGTFGQPDAGVLYGGYYALIGGFWGGETIPPLPEQHVYLPLMTR